MRPILFFSLLLMAIGCSSTKNIKSKPNELNGEWVPTYQEIGGKELPASFYAKQKLVLNDTLYTFTAESVDKGIVKVNGSNMDIYGQDGPNKGKHIPVLFKYENGLLTICYDLSGTKYPETFETKSSPLYFISIFKRSN